MSNWLSASLSILAYVIVSPGISWAVDIDRFIQIQPIQVCDDNYANCASTPLSKTFTENAYKQAGIAAIYLPIKQISDTSLLTVDGVNDVNKVGNGQSTNKQTLNAWFVKELNAKPGYTLWGQARRNGNGAVFNSSALDAGYRPSTVAHEIGHNLGLWHKFLGDADNLMTKGENRNAAASNLTQSQINKIRNSQFVQSMPTVTVDLRGATPFQSTDFFNVSFDAGPSNVSLTKITVDLSPVNAFFDPTNSPPGGSGSSFGFGSLNGVSSSDIAVRGMTDGSQLLILDIVPRAFMEGDSISFGSDVDLFSAIDSFGATPEELVGAIFSFEFDIGLSLSTVLDDDLVTASTSVSQINTVFGNPIPFGPQVPLGQLPPLGTLGDPDPVPNATPAVPLPAALPLFGTSLAIMSFIGWRRKKLT